MRVFVNGPASWNSIVYLDRLPEPQSHTVFAESSYETFGGTSLGKALNFAQLGADVTLSTLLAGDQASALIENLAAQAQIDLLAQPVTQVERHLNLMTRAGERLSIYLSAPGTTMGAMDSHIRAAMEQADALVMDLSAESSRLLDTAASTGVPIWTDIHDYDGSSEFHRPFIEQATYVFMNDDGLGDPREFMCELIARGKSLAVCTLGAQGAIALDDSGFFEVPATATEVVDTNGAGDAFMAGFMVEFRRGGGVQESLTFAARNASQALRARSLHPIADQFLQVDTSSS